MNTPLRRLATLVLVMFVALLGATTWVQYVQADSLNNDPRNVRTLYREFGSPRGPIVVAGQPIAVSTPVDDPFRYQRAYPQGELYSSVTGFYSIVQRATGLEAAVNDDLTGTADSLFWRRVQDLFTGRQPQGSSVELTIDPVLQQAAHDALGSQRGAVVALDPATGRILALVSTPGFDPNALATHDTKVANDAYQALLSADGDPLVNKAVTTRYPPGSTFKLVTAAAALESGRYAADTSIPAPDVLDLPQSSSQLHNYGNERCSPTGSQTLADALRISCNTAFAQLGLDLGADALRTQAEKFGFDDSSLQVPVTVSASVFGTPDVPHTALSAMGQADVQATPLQMAMISAAIANGGRLMTPYLVQTVRTTDLDVVSDSKPTELSQPVSPNTAATLRDMMIGVVDSGTGTAARIPGVAVAGKTGTAQTTDTAAPHAWFTGFAPADQPKVAVAVVVEHGGNLGSEATGGAVAAPIARAVMQAALSR